MIKEIENQRYPFRMTVDMATAILAQVPKKYVNFAQYFMINIYLGRFMN